eukprot:scaffold32240_cov154-Skeletonema_menzelii.AAC.2
MKSGRFTYGQRHNGLAKKSPLGEHNHRKPHRRTAFICKVSKNIGTPSHSLPLATSPRLPASRTPKMNECASIEEMVEVAFDNFLKDAGQLRDIAAFWSHSSKLIESLDQDGTVEEKEQTRVKLTEICRHTVKFIDKFDPADFSKSFLALAKIFSTLTSKRNDARDRDDMNLFRCIFVENGDQPSENPFQFFVYASMPLLPVLTPRDLACGSYALSLLSWSASLKDGITLLDSMASEVVSRVDEFDSRALSRILFDAAKSGQPQPQLFSVVARKLCDLDATRFAPGEMANILFAFATASLRASELTSHIFHNIAEAIVALYTSSTRLAWFKSADLSTIMWSFARAGELLTNPFQRTIHKAILAKLSKMHETFRLNDLSNIVWALSQSSSSPSILRKIATRINFDAQSLDYEAASMVTFLWTCCQSNVHIGELFNENSNFMKHCLEKREEYKDDELRKLYNFHLWQQELRCDGLPSELHDKCFEAHLLPSNLLSEYD